MTAATALLALALDSSTGPTANPSSESNALALLVLVAVLAYLARRFGIQDAERKLPADWNLGD